MKTHHTLLFAFLCMIISSCGMNQAQLDDQATKIVGEIYGSQTAQALANTSVLSPTIQLVTSTSTKTQKPTNTARPTRTRTPRATSTPKLDAVVNTKSVNIRKGPGTNYPILTGASQGDHLKILGQAYSCGWLKIETSNRIEGWISAELVTYSQPCNTIPAASIPPTPVQVATAAPTEKVAPTNKPAQGESVKVIVINNTNGNLTINLSGPASYSFTFTKGTHEIWVTQGTYNYTAWGCGTSKSGTQKLTNGYRWEWYCG